MKLTTNQTLTEIKMLSAHKTSQSDTIDYSRFGFDNKKYLKLQKEAIIERISKFTGGRLYLEIGGKFLHDPHASRVLPGFEADVKKQIFSSLKDQAEILFCVDSRDIISNRQLTSGETDYSDLAIKMAKQIQVDLENTPSIVINMCHKELNLKTRLFIEAAEQEGLKCYRRYFIEGYPQSTDHVLSENGYGQDDYIELHKDLVLVTGAASNSGKLSTCLGQIYLDHTNGLSSGYAKYETFPIWNLPIKHPVNLAYEAATADIGDFNIADEYHLQAYNKKAVNYNRDVDAFEIIMTLVKNFIPEDNYLHNYKSPTDMGINHAGHSITDDEIVSLASLQEISRRRGWYHQIIARGEGQREWLDKCDNLNSEAKLYIEKKGYKLSKSLI